MYNIPYYCSTVCRSPLGWVLICFLAEGRAEAVTSQHISLHKQQQRKRIVLILSLGPYYSRRIRARYKNEAARVQTSRFCCSTRVHGPSRIERIREEEKERVSLVSNLHYSRSSRQASSLRGVVVFVCGASFLSLLPFVCIRGQHEGRLISHPVRSLHERGAGREISESAVVVAAAAVRVYVHRAGTGRQKKGLCHATQQQHAAATAARTNAARHETRRGYYWPGCGVRTAESGNKGLFPSRERARPRRVYL